MTHERPVTEEETAQIHRDDQALSDLLYKLDKAGPILDEKIIDTFIKLAQNSIDKNGKKLPTAPMATTGLKSLLDNPSESVEKRRADIQILLDQLES